MKVRCKLCKNLREEDNKCGAKKSGGKNPKINPNKRRYCSKYTISPEAVAIEADKEYEKRKIPTYAPTWRYYASNKELNELGEKKGPLYVRINPNV